MNPPPPPPAYGPAEPSLLWHARKKPIEKPNESFEMTSKTICDAVCIYITLYKGLVKSRVLYCQVVTFNKTGVLLCFISNIQIAI